MSDTAADTPAAARDLPSFPFPADELSPPAVYAERRATCPFGAVRLPSGDEAVLLVTYRDIAAAMADPRLTHDLTAPGSPRVLRGPSIFDDPDQLINKEGADHLRIRRIVASAFTPRRIERWKPVIREVAGQLLDALAEAGPPTDLMAGFCYPLPVRIICRLLGVPEQDAPKFRSWSNAFLSAARMTPQEQHAQIAEFAAYAAELIGKRRAQPGTMLIDDLIAARDGSDRLTEPELQTMVIGLIAAGNETTSNSLSRFVLTLLDGGAALWDQLVAEPALVPAAVEELLRHTVLGNTAVLRLATQDVQLPSGTIHAGDAVVVPANAAQRDEEVYPDPDKVVFGRKAPPALTFGAGPHYCLGAHLARAELQIGLELLVQRLPGLRLAAAPDTLRFSGGELLSSLIELPVAW